MEQQRGFFMVRLSLNGSPLVPYYGSTENVRHGFCYYFRRETSDRLRLFQRVLGKALSGLLFLRLLPIAADSWLVLPSSRTL